MNEVLDYIDPFIDAKSSKDVPQDPTIREALFNILIQQVNNDWISYSKEYYKIYANTNEANRSRLNQYGLKIQNLFAELIQLFELCKKQNYAQDSLFQLKEKVLFFKSVLAVKISVN